MISEIYKNRNLYYQLLKDFLDGKTDAWKLREKFMCQRNQDIDQNKESGYSQYYKNLELTGKEFAFEEEYLWKLYNYTPQDNITLILNDYVKGAKKYDIKGDLFFSGIFDDLSVNIRDYYPRVGREEFEEGINIDEDELRKRVAQKLKILDENRDKW